MKTGPHLQAQVHHQHFKGRTWTQPKLSPLNPSQRQVQFINLEYCSNLNTKSSSELAWGLDDAGGGAMDQLMHFLCPQEKWPWIFHCSGFQRPKHKDQDGQLLHEGYLKMQCRHWTSQQQHLHHHWLTSSFWLSPSRIKVNASGSPPWWDSLGVLPHSEGLMDGINNVYDITIKTQNYETHLLESWTEMLIARGYAWQEMDQNVMDRKNHSKDAKSGISEPQPKSCHGSLWPIPFVWGNQVPVHLVRSQHGHDKIHAHQWQNIWLHGTCYLQLLDQQIRSTCRTHNPLRWEVQ